MVVQVVYGYIIIIIGFHLLLLLEVVVLELELLDLLLPMVLTEEKVDLTDLEE